MMELSFNRSASEAPTTAAVRMTSVSMKMPR